MLNKYVMLAWVSIVLTVGFSQGIKAESFALAKAVSYEVIPMEHQLAKLVVPIVRTYVSAQGHIAHVAGVDYLVLGDNPKSLGKLKNILLSLSLTTFEPLDLKRQLDQQLVQLSLQELTSKQITLQHIEAKVLVAALNGVVSRRGEIIALPEKSQIEIRDYPSYLAELERMILLLDQI